MKTTMANWYNSKVALLFGAGAAIMIGCTNKITSEEETQADEFRIARDSIIIAHRGFIGDSIYPENSLKSLEMADSIGVYGSEFDVHTTIDGIAVVNHDDSINGIAIQFSKFELIKDIRLSNGESLPTLDQFLKRGKELDVRLILELKSHRSTERNIEAAQIVVDLVKKNQLEEKVEYITFNIVAGKEIARLSPQSRIAFLANNVEYSPRQLKGFGFTMLAYRLDVLLEHPEIYKEASAAGMPLMTWTVNDLAMMKRVLSSAPVLIITDIPDAI